MATRLYDNEVEGAFIAERDSKWFKVKFDKAGEANVWIGDFESDIDLDLYVYEDDDEDSRLIDKSVKGRGKDDIVWNVDVKPGKYIYILVKNLSSESSLFRIKAKNYPGSSNNGEADLRITKIIPSVDIDQMTVGQRYKWKVYVENEGNQISSEYTLVLKDEDGNIYDEDDEPEVDPGDTERGTLYATIDEPGRRNMIFEIKGGESKKRIYEDEINFRPKNWESTIKAMGKTVQIANALRKLDYASMLKSCVTNANKNKQLLTEILDIVKINSGTGVAGIVKSAEGSNKLKINAGIGYYVDLDERELYTQEGSFGYEAIPSFDAAHTFVIYPFLSNVNQVKGNGIVGSATVGNAGINYLFKQPECLALFFRVDPFQDAGDQFNLSVEYGYAREDKFINFSESDWDRFIRLFKR